MTGYRDLLFFLAAGLAILFMVWVFWQFTQQLAGPEKTARKADAESRTLRVVPADSAEAEQTIPRKSSRDHRS